MSTATARFGIVFLPESLTDFGGLCRETEAAGFDWLGVADSQSVFRELYVALTLAALNTRRVKLGPLVTNPQTRHLVVTASAIASVDELSGGRAVLGLGSGDSAIYTIGAPPATVAGLEDSIADARPAHRGRAGGPRRAALARAPLGAPGADLPRRRGPAHARAGRPRGRRGDLRPGPDAGGHRAVARRASSAARARPGARWTTSTSGGSPRPAWPTAAPPRSSRSRWRWPRAPTTPSASRSRARACRPICTRRSARLQREYNAHHHEIAGAANASLPDRWDLTEFLADRFAIAGTPADCVAQLRRAMGAGARQFMITGFVPDPRAFMRRWMKEVAGAL